MPSEWQRLEGSVHVIRADLEPLHPQHLGAPCHYRQYVLPPLFENSARRSKHQESKIAKDKVLQRITPRAFATFYVEYNQSKKDDPKWDTNHASPTLTGDLAETT